MAIALKLDAKGRTSFKVIQRLQSDFETGIRRGAYLGGRDMMAFAGDKIKEKTKTGRVYLVRRGRGRRRHVASNPDTNPPEFPANLSGNLRRSLSFSVRGTDSLEFGAGAQKSNTGDAPKYARRLEEGGGTIKPRRYLRQTIDANARNLTQHIQNEVSKRVK